MKNIAFKVPESELKRLHYYMNTQEAQAPTVASFVRTAIREKCAHVQLVRSGGMLMLVPCPTLSSMSDERKTLSDEQRAQILEILRDADAALGRIAPGAVHLSDLVAWASERFHRTTDRQARRYEDNRCADLEFEVHTDGAEESECIRA